MTESVPRFFKQDAFISYAHRDNETGAVSAFHAQFEEYLRASLGREVSIWRDSTALLTLDEIEQQIRGALETSAIIVAIVSPIVESRKWCRDELGWYLSGAQLGTICVQRLFPVFMPHADPSSLPAWVQRLDMSEPRLILEPSRQELMADQNLLSELPYWERLYGWCEYASQGILAAHRAFADAFG